MPRAATTSDVFNAIAEPRRRDILTYLAGTERSVGDVATWLKMGQPSVSKHLRVLREVDLVYVRKDGRRMFYRTNEQAIKSVHDWTLSFERYWDHQLEGIKELAEEMAAKDIDESRRPK